MAVTFTGLPQWFGCGTEGDDNPSMANILYNKLSQFLGTLFGIKTLDTKVISDHQKEIHAIGNSWPKANLEGSSERNSVMSRRREEDEDIEFLEILGKMINLPHATEFPEPSLLKDFKRNHIHEMFLGMKRRTERPLERLARENSALRRMQEDNDRHQRRTVHREKRMRSLQEEVAALAADNIKTKREMEQRLRLLLEERNHLQSENLVKETMIDRLENERREDINKIISLENHLEAMKKQMNALTISLQEKERNIREKEGAIDELKTENARLETERNTSEREKDEGRKKVDEAMKEIVTLRERQEQLLELLVEEERTSEEMANAVLSLYQIMSTVDSPIEPSDRRSRPEDKSNENGCICMEDCEHSVLCDGSKLKSEVVQEVLLNEGQERSNAEVITEEDIGELLEVLEEILKGEIEMAIEEERDDMFLMVLHDILEDKEETPPEYKEILEIVHEETKMAPEDLEELLDGLLDGTKEVLRKEINMPRESLEEIVEDIEEVLLEQIKESVKEMMAERRTKRKWGKKLWKSLIRKNRQRKERRRAKKELRKQKLRPEGQEELKTQMVNKETMTDRLEHEKREDINKIISLENHLEAMKQQMNALMISLQEKERNVREKEGAIDELETENAKLEKERNTCEREKDEGRKKVEEAMKEIVTLRERQEQLLELLVEEERRSEEMLSAVLSLYQKMSTDDSQIEPSDRCPSPEDSGTRQRANSPPLDESNENGWICMEDCEYSVVCDKKDDPSSQSNFSRAVCEFHSVCRYSWPMRDSGEPTVNECDSKLQSEANDDLMSEGVQKVLLNEGQERLNAEVITEEDIGELLEALEEILKEEIEMAIEEERGDVFRMVLHDIQEDKEETPPEYMEILEIVHEETKMAPEDLEALLDGLLDGTKEMLRKEINMPRESLEEIFEDIEEILLEEIKESVKEMMAERRTRRKWGKKLWKSLIRKNRKRKGSRRAEKELSKQKVRT
ncbi:trichohyalin-like [Macrobrachium nipponense]|uniref:trichohyalin-like n=1 Tax=Macrobrachium nipponense TaxID=159736 RepID=UPI0030C82A02